MSREQIMNALKGIDWAAVGRVMSNPTDNPKQAVLLYSIVAVAVLIVLIIAYLALRSPDEAADDPSGDRDESGGSDRRAESAMSLVLSIILVPLAAGAALNLATHVPAYCSSCHQMRSSHRSWQASTHKEISCIQCHGRAGILGEPEGVIWNLGMVVSYAMKPATPTPSRASVPEDGCRRCHRGIQAAVVGSRTRIPHERVSRQLCTSCHLRTGHERGPQMATTAMSVCTSECHRQGVESTECSTCHPAGGFALDTSAGAKGYPKAAISIRNCDGCHPVEKCTACHGIYMPHPADYNSGKAHARQGFTQKSLCFEQCHTPADCLGCHKQVGTHGSDWARKHGESATPGCNDLCHHQDYTTHTRGAKPSVYFCDNCHD